MGYWGGHHWSGAGGNIADIDVILGYIVVLPWPCWDSSRLFSACRVGPPVVDFGLQSGANISLFRPAEWGQWYLILACRVGPAHVDFGLQRKGASKMISGLQRKGASVLILGASSNGAHHSGFRPAEEGGQCVDLGASSAGAHHSCFRPAEEGGQCVDVGFQCWGPP